MCGGGGVGGGGGLIEVLGLVPGICLGGDDGLVVPVLEVVAVGGGVVGPHGAHACCGVVTVFTAGVHS